MNGTLSTPSPPAASAAAAITASEVRCGDVLIYEGREIEIISRPRSGSFWFGDGRHEGRAIDWRAGSASGILFRRGDETMYRARRGVCT